jgi:predicted enzyme related to lactoylglutathione lyase
MNRVVHFEIHADDMDRAQKFYESVFGWKFQTLGPEYGGYRTIMTGPNMSELVGKPLAMENIGIDGGMTLRRGPRPAADAPVHGYVCVVGIENIDNTIKKIEAAGGTLALAKMMIPGVGWVAYYKDTEGNIFGIIEPLMPKQ